jgi:hypothetical protein
MTRTEANDILTRWKLGVVLYPPVVIDHALCVTGDLNA